MLSTNAELATAVRARLIDSLGTHAPADGARIAVDMNGSCAVLHGCVRTWKEHTALERAALATPGVASVDNRLALLVTPRLRGKRFDPRA